MFIVGVNKRQPCFYAKQAQADNRIGTTCIGGHNCWNTYNLLYYLRLVHIPNRILSRRS